MLQHNTIEYPLQDQPNTRYQVEKEAGIIVINLIDEYKNQDIKALRVADWDTHPNAKAHALIAGKLYEALWEKREAIFLPRLSTPSQQTRSQPVRHTDSLTNRGIAKEGRN